MEVAFTLIILLQMIPTEYNVSLCYELHSLRSLEPELHNGLITKIK